MGAFKTYIEHHETRFLFADNTLVGPALCRIVQIVQRPGEEITCGYVYSALF